eukprot:630365-Amorphochlora_amoeboformis.AAC.2
MSTYPSAQHNISFHSRHVGVFHPEVPKSPCGDLEQTKSRQEAVNSLQIRTKRSVIDVHTRTLLSTTWPILMSFTSSPSENDTTLRQST